VNAQLERYKLLEKLEVISKDVGSTLEILKEIQEERQRTQWKLKVFLASIAFLLTTLGSLSPDLTKSLITHLLKLLLGS